MLFPCLAAPTDKLALRVGHRVLSQRELAGACAAHAGSLAARGLQPGDRIGVWTQPAVETVVALIAHAAAGYVSVPLDPKLGDTELAHVLGDARPALCVAADLTTLAARADTTSIGRSEGPANIRETSSTMLFGGAGFTMYW